MRKTLSRIVTDTDGLIKLGKSGALETLLRAHEVLIPAEVHEEAVLGGKRALHEDAFCLEETLQRHGVDPWPRQELQEAEERESGESPGSFGSGESAAFRLYVARRADAILSDDRAFTNFLARRRVPVFASADAIVALAESGELGPDEGVESLGKLRSYIRKEVYESALHRVRSVMPPETEERKEESEGDDH